MIIPNFNVSPLPSSPSYRFEELAKGTASAPPRTENQEWLTDHLKEVERVCSQDLQAIVTAGEKCFPPSYKIVPFFVTRYHHGLVNEVRIDGKSVILPHWEPQATKSDTHEYLMSKKQVM